MRSESGVALRSVTAVQNGCGGDIPGEVGRLHLADENYCPRATHPIPCLIGFGFFAPLAFNCGFLVDFAEATDFAAIINESRLPDRVNSNRLLPGAEKPFIRGSLCHLRINLTAEFGAKFRFNCWRQAAPRASVHTHRYAYGRKVKR